MKTLRRNRLSIAFILGILTSAGIVAAAETPPIAGRQTLGISVEEMVVVTKGWSAKKHLLGKPVYSDKNDKIGSIEDVIISPDKTASFAIIGTGGFVGLDRHDVAIPFSQIELTGNRVVLPGATKDAVRALPEFQYAK